MSAIAIGALAAFPSYFGLILRVRTTLDDSLDVVAAHGVGGTVGALLTGVFAQKGAQWCRRRTFVWQSRSTGDTGSRRPVLHPL